jgi:hypothetical protein
MAKNNIFDNEFFDDVEKRINPSIGNSAYLNMRMIYGMLYAYYKFNRGTLENIYFFENLCETFPNLMHCEMSIELFEIAHHSTIIEKDRLNLLVINFFRQNFIQNWNENIKHKQRLLAELHRIFISLEFTDEEIWDLLIKDTVHTKDRILNMDHYDIMLKGLLWYNSYPQSPKFQQLGKDINKFQDKIRNNENRLWRYNPETASWRTYEDLLKTREEIDEDYIYTFTRNEVIEDKKRVVKIKKEYTLEETTKLVMELLQKKTTIPQIREQLADKKIPTDNINKALIEAVKENQKKLVENLKKQGKFVPDMSEEEKKKLRPIIKQTSPPASAAPGGAKGGDTKKKK